MLLARLAAASAARLHPALGWPAAAAAGAAAFSTAAAGSGSTSGPTAADQQLRQAFSYCVQQVRAHDYENYLWVTQMPKELRAPLFALRAFNVETALIGEHAKGEMLVLMRCQWWKDALNDCYRGKPPAQPVVAALAEVLRCGHLLTRYRLQQIVAAREEDLTRPDQQPPSLAALEALADGTAGQLLHLQLEAAGLSSGAATDGTTSAEHAAAAEHAAGHLGRAVGIVGALRGTYKAAAAQRVYLPADLCAAHGVGAADVLQGRDSEGLRDVALAVASAAKQHLEEARRLRGDVAPAARPLFLPAVAAGMYLDALEAAQFNLFDQRLLRGGVPHLTYQLRLKWAALRGRY